MHNNGKEYKYWGWQAPCTTTLETYSSDKFKFRSCQVATDSIFFIHLVLA